MITLQYKSVQLSGSNLTLPICSRVGVILTLRLWASIYNDYSQMQTHDSLMHTIRVMLLQHWLAVKLI